MSFLTWSKLHAPRRSSRKALCSSSIDASGGALLRQELTRRLLCNRQWPKGDNSRVRRGSAHALFRCASMPIWIGEMGFAKPLTAALAILLSAMVTGFIHVRNCLTELFLGLYSCRSHGYLRDFKKPCAREGRLSGRFRLRQLCPRRYTQYTPGRRKLLPYFAPSPRRREYSP